MWGMGETDNAETLGRGIAKRFLELPASVQGWQGDRKAPNPCPKILLCWGMCPKVAYSWGVKKKEEAQRKGVMVGRTRNHKSEDWLLGWKSSLASSDWLPKWQSWQFQLSQVEHGWQVILFKKQAKTNKPTKKKNRNRSPSPNLQLYLIYLFFKALWLCWKRISPFEETVTPGLTVPEFLALHF